MKIETLSESAEPEAFLERFLSLSASREEQDRLVLATFPTVEKELFVLSEQGRDVARLASSRTTAQRGSGFFGFFALDPAITPSSDRLATLFRAAEEWILHHCGPTVIGPINLNVWLSYRFRIDAGLKSLPWEPRQPLSWVSLLSDLGYTVDTVYRTEIYQGLDRIRTRNEKLRHRFQEKNCSIAPICLRKADTARKLYEINIKGFTANHLYEPITFEQYRTLHIEPYLDTDLSFSFISFDATGNPLGYVFAFPFEDCLTIKSFVVDPTARSLGTAGALLSACLEKAAHQDLNKVIASTMREGNVSTRFGRYATRLLDTHRYALFRKELA